MKSILKEAIRVSISCVCAALWLTGMWIIPLYPNPVEKPEFEVTQQRADYFIVKINTSPALSAKITIGARGHIYLENRDDPVGTFKVIDVEGDEYLCVIDSTRPGSGSSPVHRVSFAFAAEPAAGKTTLKSSGQTIALALNVNSKRMRFKFKSLSMDGKYYISEKPVPADFIEPLDLTGIKNVLYAMEEDSHRQFSANLIRFEQVHPLGLDKIIDFSNKDKIFPGTVEGNLSMIYEENGVLRSTRISSETLRKFKNDVFIHVVLERKEKGKKGK